MNKNKKFYFTIVDDTDDSTLENTKPIYDLLYKNGIKITKTVWVYPPRDKTSYGDSIQRPEYLEFIKDIKNKGFEIGLHNVGSGSFSRNEIINGIEEFKNKIGEYPQIHINHSYNPDSIYGGYKRFNWPINFIVKILYKQYSGIFQGEVRNSEYFWGGKHKEIIKFNRNHEFSGLNTIKYDKYMPYIDPKRCEFSNYWFSATFAPNQWIFNRLVNEKSIKKLEKENGICVLFTHLGYYMKDGKIDDGFIERIEYLSKKQNGIYIPISELMDRIVTDRVNNGKEPYPVLPSYVKFKMELRHLYTRLKYRKLLKLDDYNFKTLDKNMFLENN